MVEIKLKTCILCRIYRKNFIKRFDKLKKGIYSSHLVVDDEHEISDASSLKIYRRTDKSGHLSLRAKAKEFKFKKLASSEANGVENTPSKPKRRVRATTEIKQKSLILAQIERWRNALHMQVER